MARCTEEGEVMTKTTEQLKQDYLDAEDASYTADTDAAYAEYAAAYAAAEYAAANAAADAADVANAHAADAKAHAVNAAWAAAADADAAYKLLRDRLKEEKKK
jgi:hypothetical protein